MRYGILSDVHGNLEALEVALAHLDAEGVDDFIFLGDAVGYGPNPDEVCTLLRQRCSYSVIGNHDAALVGRLDYRDYYEAARHGIDWCKTKVSAVNFDWLANLPYTQEVGDILLSHGAPAVPELFDYLFSAEQVHDMLDAVNTLAPVTLIGHSHLTISFRIMPEEVVPMIQDTVFCEPNSQFIITAGSVGQPRDRNPKTCCGIYDSHTRVFEFHRLDYPRSLTRQKILDAGLAPAFGDRLLVGI